MDDEAARSGAVGPGEERPVLRVLRAHHRFDKVVALDDVSLTVQRGEFVSLLGHSGSGKTTLLRVIAGLEVPTAIDALELGGEDVRHVGAAARNCTTVFQHYALFPHMNVAANIAYGLKVRRVPSDEQRRRVEAALELVRLPGFGSRRIFELSGGQRQRVALARGIVTSPALLLLDEPLGALDERLRQDMQIELLDMQRRLGISFVYVTHSQEEALTMSDRVVVMRGGRIVQEGAPSEVFDRPASRFVADFMGIENLVTGVVETVDGDMVRLRVGEIGLFGRWCGPQPPRPGLLACAAIRAERVRLGAEEAGVNSFPARLRDRIYRGKYSDWRLDTPLGLVSSRRYEMGDPPADVAAVNISFADCAVTVLDEAVERAA